MDVDEGGWTVSATDSQLERERDGFLEILLDLITELNAVIETRQSSHDLFRSLRKSADKAEVRLKEVTDE